MKRPSSALALGSFVAWTLLVWGSRIRNIWTDAELSTSGQLGRTALASSFIVLAGWVLARRSRRAIGVLASWTVAVWVVRGVTIASADHGGGFIAVHSVLAAASILWAAWAWSAAGGYDQRRHGPADHRRREAVEP